jgi:hypothetical protein
VANSFHMFNANELEKGAMDLGAGVWDVFIIVWPTPRLFKTLTNFTLV